MRNRQRQYEESIRGTVDQLNNIGFVQSFSNWRQRQMLYGRLAVAFSDQMSAIPTWLAAYKKAFLAGEAHADAVFIADKEMSRAHGSSFIGDKPAISRMGNNLPGEITRWFTSLYNFWNHQVNNQFQLTWDVAAALRGPPNGPPNLPPSVARIAGPSGGGGGIPNEPGANAASIARRVGLIMAIILIEEQATAAKDETNHGFLTGIGLAGLRYFGAGFVGLREFTNGFAGGYEPSTGMIGVASKAVYKSVEDLKKSTGVKAGAAKHWIINTATLLGIMTGAGGSQVGRTLEGNVRLAQGRVRFRPYKQDPTLKDLRQLQRTGDTKARKH
jgi:hypothetical protein